MTVARPRRVEEKLVKDFEKLLFNYIHGKFDLALAFNSSRIITHTCGITGRLLQDYDSVLDRHVSAGPRVVVDNDGNVIICGAGPGASDSL